MDEIQTLRSQVAQLVEELRITDALLTERNRVLDAIPPCPVHGMQCVPHALEWVAGATRVFEMVVKTARDLQDGD